MTKETNSSLRFAVLAVDAVVFRISAGKLEVLLGKVFSEDNIFYGKWAHVGGLIRVDENADESVSRLLHDKAGIRKIYKEQLYTFSDVKRDPRGRVVTIAYIGILKDEDTQDGQMEKTWKEVGKISRLAYDHDQILKVAVERLKAKINYTDIARHFLPTEFTLTELQSVYEIVLDKKMDKRNFRKQIMILNILKDIKKTIKRGVMRPAKLYKFI